jgi:hypothetical protein
MNKNPSNKKREKEYRINLFALIYIHVQFNGFFCSALLKSSPGFQEGWLCHNKQAGLSYQWT